MIVHTEVSKKFYLPTSAKPTLLLALKSANCWQFRKLKIHLKGNVATDCSKAS